MSGRNKLVTRAQSITSLTQDINQPPVFYEPPTIIDRRARQTVIPQPATQCKYLTQFHRSLAQTFIPIQNNGFLRNASLQRIAIMFRSGITVYDHRLQGIVTHSSPARICSTLIQYVDIGKLVATPAMSEIYMIFSFCIQSVDHEHVIAPPPIKKPSSPIENRMSRSQLPVKHLNPFRRRIILPMQISCIF